MVWIAWFIRHYAYMFSTNTITAIVFFKHNFFLQQHNQLVGFAVLFKEIIHIMQLINILPTPTGKGFHVSGEAYIVKNTVPIQRVCQVTE